MVQGDSRYLEFPGYGATVPDWAGYEKRMAAGENLIEESPEEEETQARNSIRSRIIDWIRRHPKTRFAAGSLAAVLTTGITAYEVCNHKHNSSLCKPIRMSG